MLQALMNTPNSLNGFMKNPMKHLEKMASRFMSPPGQQRQAPLTANNAGVLSPEMMRRQQPAAAPGMGGLPDLWNNLGMDQLDLSPGTAFTMQYARAQFEINYQSMQTINTANGVQTQEVNFSFKASFEYLSVQAGQGVQNPFAPDEETGEVDPMKALMDYFSPEKTAGRILDFATSFFPMSSHHQEGGDTEGARQRFADFMGNAIQSGFDQAQAMLGALPDEVQEDIDKTHTNVFDGLKDFVKNGLDKNKLADGVYASIQATHLELAMELQIKEEEQEAQDVERARPAELPHVDTAA